MSWKIHLRKDLKKEKHSFFEIIENFDFLGDIIFKERNTLRRIESSHLGILAVKSFKIPHIFNQYVYSGLRKSKAFRSFFHAEHLISKSIHTPAPLAYLEEIQNGKLLRSFYFSEYFPYDFTFRELIESRDSFPDWNFIMKSFTEFVYRIHKASVLFKDLSPGNVLIKKTDSLMIFSWLI